MVGAGRIGCGGDANVRLGGRTDRGVGVDGWDGDELSWWEDNVANVTEHDSPLAYALLLEHHHLIMSTLG